MLLSAATILLWPFFWHLALVVDHFSHKIAVQGVVCRSDLGCRGVLEASLRGFQGGIASG
jgi:hypothetical protein